MHKRTLLAALAVTASSVVGGAAYATVSPEDEVTPVISVTTPDKTGDVRVMKAGRDLPKRLTHSVAMKQVTYNVDRTTETLTIGYPVQRILNNDRYRQLFATLVTTDKDMSNMNSPFVELISSAAKVTVRVFTYDGGSDFQDHVCKAAGSTADTKTDVVTQTVPFSCLRGALDHGYLRSFALLEGAPKGGDLAGDLTPYTRDLPLSPYVAPTDGGTQG